MMEQKKNVAPLAGAWIEITIEMRPLGTDKVAPLAGAWIEIRCVVGRRILNASLPSRERGLK